MRCKEETRLGFLHHCYPWRQHRHSQRKVKRIKPWRSYYTSQHISHRPTSFSWDTVGLKCWNDPSCCVGPTYWSMHLHHHHHRRRRKRELCHCKMAWIWRVISLVRIRVSSSKSTMQLRIEVTVRFKPCPTLLNLTGLTATIGSFAWIQMSWYGTTPICHSKWWLILPLPLWWTIARPCMVSLRIVTIDPVHDRNVAPSDTFTLILSCFVRTQSLGMPLYWTNGSDAAYRSSVQSVLRRRAFARRWGEVQIDGFLALVLTEERVGLVTFIKRREYHPLYILIQSHMPSMVEVLAHWWATPDHFCRAQRYSRCEEHLLSTVSSSDYSHSNAYPSFW